jgi:hypothetical protein
MPHGFDAYRVFISTPGDLEPDCKACYEAVALANETIAMPAKVLLVSVGLRENGQIENNRSIVADNVRWSTYFIQVFKDDWGPRDLFRKLFLQAVECNADAAMPMREIVVCLKEAPQETNADILAFRGELEERQDVTLFHYKTVDELSVRLTEVSERWARAIIGSATGPSR